MKTGINSKGFTLLEVLIVLVILAVLAGLAIPTYISAVEKSRKQEAVATLGAIRSSEMRYQAAYNTFTNSFNNLDFNPNATVVGQTPHFTYSVTAAAAATFTARATRDTNINYSANSGAPGAYTITINETGAMASQY